MRLKTCNGCDKETQIWKNYNGKQYCRTCWNFVNPDRKPLAKVSKGKAIEDREYTKLRKEFMMNHPFCELRLAGCMVHATDVHHTKLRGIEYLNVATWKAVCRSCHQRGDKFSQDDQITLGFKT